jgi:hypothetical protein
MQAVALKLARGADGGALHARVRELTGADEMAVDGTGSRAALSLLARVATVSDGRAPGRLAAGDRDRLLACVYRRTWGDAIRSTLACRACAARFDLGFSLRALQEHLDAGAAQAEPRADREFLEAGGERIVVPCADDELAAARQAAPVEALAAAACPETAFPAATVAARLEALAPILDLELLAACAECGHEQAVEFDLQSFLLARLLNERALLTRDIHVLASAYRWSFPDILALPRPQRQAQVAMVEAAQSRARDGARWSAA